MTKMSKGQYYFSRLSDERKKIYKTILSGVEALAKEIKLPLRPTNEISMIFDRVLLDNPMIFYVSSFNLSSDLYKNKCAVMPNYKYSASFIRQNINAIRRYLRTFDTIKAKSDIDKEVYVHDYCLNNFSYDYAFGEYAHSVLGAVLNKTAVCEGIAKFVKLALDYVGVSSLVVLGKANNPAHDGTPEDHAWNVVKIEGKTYHLDVTFDMSLKDKINRYDYFNLADDDIKIDHNIVSDAPVCNTAGNDFYSVNSMVAYNTTELKKYIESRLIQGKKNAVVKLKNVTDVDTIIDKVMDIAQRTYLKVFMSVPMLELRYNQSQLVFEVSFM